MPRPTIIEFADSIARVPGFEALTPPWRATLRLLYGLPLEPADVDFLTVATHRSRDALASYAPGRFTELWARVGRRGRKSSVAVLIAVYEALFGDHESHIVPGEIALIPVISKDLSGSETVRRFEHSFLDALGIGYRETRFGNVGATVIDGSRIALACLACSSTAPRGPAIPVAILDEIGFWQSSDAYANPDTEILAALRPAQAQFPGRKLLSISSPFAEIGVFHTTVEAALGNDGNKRSLAVEGPTWQWSPSVTEELTHELEPDPDTHSREYGAKPSAIGSSIVFATSAVDQCFGRTYGGSYSTVTYQTIGVLDMSSGGSDSVTAGVCQVVKPGVDFQELAGPTGCIHEGHKPAFDEYGNFVRMVKTYSRQDIATNELVEIEIPKLRPLLVFQEIMIVKGGFWGDLDGEQLMAGVGTMFQRWGVRQCYADKFERGLARNELRKYNVLFNDLTWTAESKHDAVIRLKRLMSDQQLVFCECPTMQSELKAYQKKPTPGGIFRYAAKGKNHDDCVALCINAALCDIEGRLQGSELFNRGGRVEVPGR